MELGAYFLSLQLKKGQKSLFLRKSDQIFQNLGDLSFFKREIQKMDRLGIFEVKKCFTRTFSGNG